jgi:DNA-binding IclR family transcriptional regulator
MKQQAPARYLVPALQRGLELLLQFDRHEPVLTGAELSRRMALPRASVFRMLQTLEQMGFVERVGESASYRLSIGVLRLGFEYLASMELSEHGRPVIDTLRDQTGYSAHLVVRDGTEVVFVAKSAGRSAIFNSVQVGARLPAHATVLGRILLGSLSGQELAALYGGQTLKAFTEHTPTSLAQLRKMIEQETQRGYAISEGGFESGISVVAAPVFDQNGLVAAAVSVTVPLQQIEPALAESLVAAVRDAAARLTQRLSHQPATGQGAVRLGQPGASPNKTKEREALTP